MRSAAITLVRYVESRMPQDVDRPVVIDIQTVLDYVNSMGESAPFDLDSLPCVTPPWPRCLMAGTDRGVAFVWEVAQASATAFEIGVVGYGEVRTPARLLARGRFELNSTGGVESAESEWAGRRPEWGELWGEGEPLMVAPLEALAMCHIKGATITDESPLSRPGDSLMQRRPQPVYTYHTLRIEAVERITRDIVLAKREGGSRIHLVRGHYKDFRNGNGVGGNPNAKGIYWTPAHIRGAKERGMVAKDYYTGKRAG